MSIAAEARSGANRPPSRSSTAEARRGANRPPSASGTAKRGAQSGDPCVDLKAHRWALRALRMGAEALREGPQSRSESVTSMPPTRSADTLYTNAPTVTATANSKLLIAPMTAAKPKTGPALMSPLSAVSPETRSA